MTEQRKIIHHKFSREVNFSIDGGTLACILLILCVVSCVAG